MDTKKIVTFSLVGLLASGAAWAEMVQGMIVRIDQSNNMVSIRQIGRPAKNTTEQLDVRFRPDTKTKNIASVEELAVGQEVKVDIRQDRGQNLIEAKSIEVTAAGVPAASSELFAEQQRADQPRTDMGSQSRYGSDLTPRGQAPTPVSQGVPSAAESSSVASQGPGSDSGY